MNYSRFLNLVSASRKPSPLREMTSILARASPSVVFLATGLPNPDLFPFDAAKVTLKDGTHLDVDTSAMHKALQYGPTPGYPELVDRLKDLQRKWHKITNFDKYDLVVTTGSQDGLCKAIEMMINPEDPILISEPTYPGTLGIFNPYRPKFLSIESDKQGMKPDSLRSVLQTWSSGKSSEESKTVLQKQNPEKPSKDSVFLKRWGNPAAAGTSTEESRISSSEVSEHKPVLEKLNLLKSSEVSNVVPKFLYINPTGSNPSGSTLSLERRQEIYKIAQEYDLLILEDDPYYFMQFTESLLPSFLSIDVDGRVIRFDSFSKILSSGMRLGYVTGPKPLIERINYHMQISVLHSSNLSQVFINELLKNWGDEGFENHVKKVKDFYQSQKNLMMKCANNWLKDLVEWDEPIAGMFLWMKVLDVNDTYAMIMEKAIDKEVVLVPGCHFFIDNTKPSPYLRASYSIATEEKMSRGFMKLAELIKEEKTFSSKIGEKAKAISIHAI